MSEKLLLIDGHSLLFRAFYGMPGSMSAPDGTPTNAVYGFLTILNKVLEEEKPQFLACAFDLSAPTFRHQKYPAYKGNRAPAPDEFHVQVPLIKKILEDMKVPVITCSGWEADDILGTLARAAEERNMNAVILSGDRDLLQLASDSTQIVLPKTHAGKTDYERFSPKEVKESFGVSPDDFIQLKALMGDTSDNVPGLPGVGPKTALKILTEFGSIENAHSHVEDIKPKKAKESMRDHYDQLLLSLDLVTIRTNAPVRFDEDTFRVSDIHTQAVYDDFRALNFKSFLKDFDQKKEVLSSELRWEQLHEIEDVENLVHRLSEREAYGLSFLTKGDHLFGAAFYADQTASVVFSGDSLTEAYLKKSLGALARGKGIKAVPDAKAMCRVLDLASSESVFDVSLAAYLLDPLKADWDAASVAAGYLSRTIPAYFEMFKKESPAAAVSTKEGKAKLAGMLAAEASAAYDSMPLLKSRLQEENMLDLFRQVEMPLTSVLASMENIGMLCSREELQTYSRSLSDGIAGLTASIYRAAGETFNINSTKQLGSILFEKLHLPAGKKTKTGYSTAADVLEKMAPEYPIVRDILHYRTLTKLKSTYAEGLSDYIAEDGRIHTVFHQTVTATGRLSSSDPNLQNIPMREELGRRIRKCFYPSEECVFVDADYSQIELRILAHMSGDAKLIGAYREEKDIHRTTASQVFHVPFEEVTDEQRRNAKAVNFGIVYGISSFGLSQGLSISRAEAREYIAQYFATYPGIKSFLDEQVAFARKNGYAVSLYGRRRPVPELKSSNFQTRSFGERVAMNSPIQGTAADIMKIAMNRVYSRLQREKLSSRLILQIHDELLIEAPLGEAEYVKKILTEEMEHAAELSVPLSVDCHIGSDWYEAK